MRSSTARFAGAAVDCLIGLPIVAVFLVLYMVGMVVESVGHALTQAAEAIFLRGDRLAEATGKRVESWFELPVRWGCCSRSVDIDCEVPPPARRADDGSDTPEIAPYLNVDFKPSDFDMPKVGAAYPGGSEPTKPHWSADKDN